MSLDPNLGMVERIATALGPLRTRMVFVGGTATGLLITDPMAPAIRATKDVDVIVEVATHGGYYQIEKALRLQGFRNDTRDCPDKGGYAEGRPSGSLDVEPVA